MLASAVPEYFTTICKITFDTETTGYYFGTILFNISDQTWKHPSEDIVTKLLTLLLM